jgi:hypothetical protein
MMNKEKVQPKIFQFKTFEIQLRKVKFLKAPERSISSVTKEKQQINTRLFNSILR